MQFLTAAGVLAMALCLVNLLLIVGVVRRLREHETRLAELQELRPAMGPRFLPVGSGVPEFSSATIDGKVVSHRTLAGGRSVIAFLQSNCRPCHDRLPALRALAAEMPGGRERVMAVVTGDGGAAEMIDGLREAVQVVSGAQAAPVVRAFEVTGFPTFYAIEGGEVRAAGADPRHMAVPVAG
jgi:hypothetical protein